MIGGFETFIETQRALPGECRLSLIEFDHEYLVKYAGKNIADVPKFTLEPRGMTSLFDAIGRAISETGDRLSKMKEEDRPSQVLFVIITDGQENSSREYSRERVFNMLTHQREKYSWEFTFLGANQDSLRSAADLGISVNNAVTFDATKGGTRGLMKGLTLGVASYRARGASAGDVYGQDLYDRIVDKDVPGDVSPKK